MNVIDFALHRYLYAPSSCRSMYSVRYPSPDADSLRYDPSQICLLVSVDEESKLLRYMSTMNLRYCVST